MIRTAYLAAACALACTAGCVNPVGVGRFRCKVSELRDNPTSGYYDAVVRVTSVRVPVRSKDRFVIKTTTGHHSLTNLTFEREGASSEVEVGDVFVLPLERPDYTAYGYYIPPPSAGRPTRLQFMDNFRDRIPEAQRWHPTHSEAMRVADTIAVVSVQGVWKAMPLAVGEGWRLRYESTVANACWLQYVRNELTLNQEHVHTVCTRLDAKQRERLASMPEAKFLKSWNHWTRKYGEIGVVDNHLAVIHDGMKWGGWSETRYQYVYTDKGCVVEVSVRGNPRNVRETAR